MRAFVCSVVTSFLLFAPMLVEAQDEAPASRRVVLFDPDCGVVSFDWEPFQSLLSLELADDGVTALANSDEGGDALASFRIVTACSQSQIAPDVVRVEIEDRVTQKHLARDFDLAGVPMRSRARALALGAAELLRASWAELAMPSVPSPAVPVPAELREAVRVLPRRLLSDPSPPPVRPDQAPEPSIEMTDGGPPRLYLRAGPSVRVYASGNLALIGGFLQADVTLDPLLALRLGVSAGFGEASHPLGDVDFAEALGHLGLSFGTRALGARLSLTPAIELGWGGVWGHSVRPDVTDGAGSAPLLNARIDLDVTFAVGDVLDLYAAVGAGHAILGLRAAALGTAFSGITGPSVQIAFGIGLHVD